MECYERTCCVIGLGYLGCRNGVGQGVLEYVFCSNHLRFLERVFGGRKTNADCGVGMKTPEDEAFDDLAKQQGAWGGGFQAKRQAAMDKINSDFDEEYKKMHEDRIKYGTSWEQDGKRIDPMSVYKESAQEPVALQWLVEMIMSDCGCSTNNERLLERVMARINQYERANTPPQREWADLTYEDWKKIEDMPDTFYQGVAWAQAKLKEKNNGT